MTFTVPQGGSCICHLEIQPQLPKDGKAAEWILLDTSINQGKKLNQLDVDFSRNSTNEQRQYERMILVITISPDVQNATQTWRFVEDGIQFCTGKGDYLDDMTTSISNNGQVLTCEIKCLTDIPEEANFSFVAMHMNRESGECAIYASADPGSRFRRR